MKKLVPIIILSILIGGIGAFFLFGPQDTQAKEAAYFSYTPGDCFITNVNGSKALVKTTIVLELEEREKKKQQEFLDANQHIIREIIVFTLSGKTEKELRANGIHEQLRKEIAEKISEKLQIDYLHTIYFNDYVLQ